MQLFTSKHLRQQTLCKMLHFEELLGENPARIAVLIKENGRINRLKTRPKRPKIVLNLIKNRKTRHYSIKTT